MISAEEAWSRIEASLSRKRLESIDRRKSDGRVLAEDVHSTADLPASDVSAMDGYAIARAVEPGMRLPVVATIAAGDRPGFELPGDCAVRIMTGAPVPAATVAVVPVEETAAGADFVTFNKRSATGAHIRRRGEIVEAGHRILEPGTRLGPGALSLLASHGHAEVSVFAWPSIAFVSTGDEVVPPDREPEPGQLRDSHTDFLLAATRSLGLDIEPLGIARDSEESLAPLLRRGLQSDVLLISGGVSMGAFDVVEDVLADLDCEPLFDSVAVQPGKPLVVARHARGLVFGLPGNPASVMVSFWLFVRPALRRLMGLDDRYWQGALNGVLAGPLPGAKSRDRFLPAEIEFDGGQVLVHPAPPKGSHDLMAYARGSALVRVPANAAQAEVGAACQILPLVDWTQRPRRDR